MTPGIRYWPIWWQGFPAAGLFFDYGGHVHHLQGRQPVTIAWTQLKQVVKDSGGEVAVDRHLAAYLVNLPDGSSVPGVLVELAEMGLESWHVKLLGSSTVKIELAGVTR